MHVHLFVESLSVLELFERNEWITYANVDTLTSFLLFWLFFASILDFYRCIRNNVGEHESGRKFLDILAALPRFRHTTRRLNFILMHTRALSVFILRVTRGYSVRSTFMPQNPRKISPSARSLVWLKRRKRSRSIDRFLATHCFYDGCCIKQRLKKKKFFKIF